MLSSVKSLLVGSGLISMALAITPISDSDMGNLLNAGGVDLAMKAQPMWFFGQAMNRPPCIPTSALTSNNQQTPSAGLCAYPDVGCGCRTPGVSIGNPSPSFPVYYSYSNDWERLIVVWAKGSDNNWRQNYLLLSQHSGYAKKNWADIQNTLNTGDASQRIGGDNGRQNLDHPKVYVAWSKHAHYDTRNTGWNDALSQLTDNAFRSQDWWYFNTASDYIRCDRSTQCGQIIGNMNWGDASSNPPSVHDGLCSAS
ncbi:hypothetical protein PT974_05981 [Cladobotryum mycophilum]|uniref:DUF1554 domain-containing protein n=1 Tax=Cladobotryum mycophilum TaxID=491253 RepID=A0ABR0SKA7_9HYPO